jgi:hypothetical protein
MGVKERLVKKNDAKEYNCVSHDCALSVFSELFCCGWLYVIFLVVALMVVM